MPSLFSLFHQLKHFFRAKNLHGVHSPFVYTFNETILNGKSKFPNSQQYQACFSFLNNQKQIELLSRMVSFYHFSKIIYEDNQIYHSEGNAQNGILWIITDAKQFPIINHENDMVLMLGIYENKRKYSSWKILYRQELVKLSIDTYNMGILFFKMDFLVKQHFVLKF